MYDNRKPRFEPAASSPVKPHRILNYAACIETPRPIPEPLWNQRVQHNPHSIPTSIQSYRILLDSLYSGTLVIPPLSLNPKPEKPLLEP